MKLSLFALALLLAAPQDKVDLKWKLQKAQELCYRSSSRNVMEGGAGSAKQETSTTFSLTVADLDDKGVASVTGKFVALAAKADAPQEYEYDSEKDKEPPAEGPVAMMAKLIGQSFTMKLASTGRIAEVKGFDKIVDAMTQGAAGDDTQVMIRQTMKQMFSDETYKGMLQQMFPPLPADPVAKGESWTSDFLVKLPFIGGVKFVMKSKLSDLKEDTAVIDNEIAVELKGGAEDKDNPLAGMIELKLAKGKSSGNFSLSKGHYVSLKGTMEMTVAFAGQEMPLKTETEVKLIEKKKNF